jgi:eukaryotic translation initiation factor 2C
VDSVVVDPRDADFYLFGHAAIIGTSRPMHNHVLLNEGKYTMPELEQLMFYFSHLYQRCSRSVSIPAPAYYAHLAAYRARFYLPRGAFSDTESQSSRSSGGRKSTLI